jgi:hypothetical protein
MKLKGPRNRGSHPYGLPLVKSGLYISCAYPEVESPVSARLVKTPKQQECIEFLWDAFETNYKHCKYQFAIGAAALVIEEMIALAKQMREANARGEALDLSEDELAFYDALEVNDSAVKVLGEPTLIKIARELVETVKRNVTIDWTVRENVRAQLRVIVKRILRKYGYPPDKQEKATQTVLEQAEVLSELWAVA